MFFMHGFLALCSIFMNLIVGWIFTEDLVVLNLFHHKLKQVTILVIPEIIYVTKNLNIYLFTHFSQFYVFIGWPTYFQNPKPTCRV